MRSASMLLAHSESNRPWNGRDIAAEYTWVADALANDTETGIPTAGSTFCWYAHSVAANWRSSSVSAISTRW